MARTVNEADLTTRPARMGLRPGRQPHWMTIEPHKLHLGYRRQPNQQVGIWVKREVLGPNRYRVTPLGRANDIANKGMSFNQAMRAVVTTAAAAALIEKKRATVIAKALAFYEHGVVPACCLYRQYDMHGDLLYVGITLEPIRRQRRHLEGSAWKNFISAILIEPFATREEALAAEEIAIRREFPKHNKFHNGREPWREVLRMIGQEERTATMEVPA